MTENQDEGSQSALVDRLLPAPAEFSSAGNAQGAWSVIAHNGRVTKSWLRLCENLRENCIRCYQWLQFTPMQPINCRCYALRHKNYAGVWAYEVGSSERIYYRPDEDRRRVLVYYAGPHPSKIPYPPED